MKRSLIVPSFLAAATLLLIPWMPARAEDATKEKSEPFKRLSVDEVEKRMANPGVHVYDGNNDEVYANGHLPGAVHLFSQDIKEGVLPADKSTPLIFYCHSEK